ncbi:hypothetical protein [Streptomyces sp. x-80]|uniref:hypothetical protein n=1 Tax=Streptomyces sp. x-80 TaxID=2789282 RepID=UPI00397FA1F4
MPATFGAHDRHARHTRQICRAFLAFLALCRIQQCIAEQNITKLPKVAEEGISRGPFRRLPGRLPEWLSQRPVWLSAWLSARPAS